MREVLADSAVTVTGERCNQFRDSVADQAVAVVVVPVCKSWPAVTLEIAGPPLTPYLSDEMYASLLAIKSCVSSCLRRPLFRHVKNTVHTETHSTRVKPTWSIKVRVNHNRNNRNCLPVVKRGWGRGEIKISPRAVHSFLEAGCAMKKILEDQTRVTRDQR